MTVRNWGVIYGKHKLVGTGKIEFFGMCSSGNYRHHRNGSDNIVVINSDLILAGFTIRTGNT